MAVIRDFVTVMTAVAYVCVGIHVLVTGKRAAQEAWRLGEELDTLPRAWKAATAFAYAVLWLEAIEHGVGQQAQRQESGEGEGGGG
ncbi:hypothetical protein DTO164E3_2963 [Paecilomyces variotii]|nr:hypothetical protein DTO164E3_2963 [Paecilomyces variotii]KAJ9209091.1 hypothetical protein DTO032I3_308 [Paecilomyces variotii]KAJ9244438.1 hypothetical protein DTO169E5_1656 [Paecilomyces variotii]KAJ9269479.1 hypothetical protein DTO212C5_4542 [Paecilomyces variotii]KAJ9282971.1 hypothetical protein DTO021D3_308 [Paecilomyces variotii]